MGNDSGTIISTIKKPATRMEKPPPLALPPQMAAGGTAALPKDPAAVTPASGSAATKSGGKGSSSGKTGGRGKKDGKKAGAVPAKPPTPAPIPGKPPTPAPMPHQLDEEERAGLRAVKDSALEKTVFNAIRNHADRKHASRASGASSSKENMQETAESGLGIAGVPTELAEALSDSGSNGIPIVGSVVTCIQSATNLVKAGWRVIQTIRKADKDSTGRRGEVIRDSVSGLLGMAEAAKNICSAASKEVQWLPYVSAIAGCVDGVIGACFDGFTIARTCVQGERMKKQRKAMEQDGGLRGHLDTLKADTAENKIDVDVGGGKTRTRARRVDDYYRAKRADMTEEEKEKLLDHSITSELERANDKRFVRSSVDFVAKDLMGVLSSLLQLIPEGYAQATGAGLKGAIGLGYGAKAIFEAIRQKARRTGAFHTNINKSTQEKAKYRHFLAQRLYSHLSHLEGAKLTEIDPDEVITDEEKWKERKQTVAHYLPRYQLLERQVEALGVGYGVLTRAQSRSQMVAMMTKGFYRDNK